MNGVMMITQEKARKWEQSNENHWSVQHCDNYQERVSKQNTKEESNTRNKKTRKKETMSNSCWLALLPSCFLMDSLCLSSLQPARGEEGASEGMQRRALLVSSLSRTSLSCWDWGCFSRPPTSLIVLSN